MEFVTYFNLLTILLFGLIWVGIVTFLRLKKKKSLVYLLLFTIFYVYLFKVLDYTLIQFQSLLLLKLFTPDLILRGGTAEKSMILIPLITLTLEDLKTSLLNILLFVPFGFGLPFIMNIRMKKIVVIGVLFSIAIELLQLISGFIAKMTFRVADINDVIFNTVGVVIGYFAFVILAKWMRSRNYKNIIIAAILVIAVAGAAFYGYRVYQQPVSSGVGAGSGQTNRSGNDQEGEIPQSGDLCGGTGGNGQILSVGENTFIMKRNDGRRQNIKLTSQATIETSSGSASVSDLKKGNRVTLVGGPNFDGSFTADTVVVCNATGSATPSGQ